MTAITNQDLEELVKEMVSALAQQKRVSDYVYAQGKRIIDVLSIFATIYEDELEGQPWTDETPILVPATAIASCARLLETILVEDKQFFMES